MGFNEIEHDILRNIREHGWFCMSVFDDESDAPPFSYTVGFTQTLDCPEFIIFGLDSKTSHAILWNVFNVIKQGKVPADNRTWGELINNFTCVTRAVHPTNIVRECFNSALWFWGDPKQRGKTLDAFQIVWPDAQGRLPWDKDCAPGVRDCQTPLYLANRIFY